LSAAGLYGVVKLAKTAGRSTTETVV